MTSELAWREQRPSDVWQLVMSLFAFVLAIEWGVLDSTLFQTSPLLLFLKWPPWLQMLMAIYMLAYGSTSLIFIRLASIRRRVIIWAVGSATWTFLGLEMSCAALEVRIHSMLGVLLLLCGLGFAARIVLWHRHPG